jgi:hypothetical protein
VASNLQFRPSGRGCSDRQASRRLTAYCFGALDNRERDAFEAHLLDCDFCWAEVRRLAESVRALREDKELLQSFSPVEVGSMFGYSTRLTWPFAGHARHVAAASTLYGLLYGIALLMEVAYAFNLYGSTALRLLPLVFLWIAGTTAAGLYLCGRRIARGLGNGIIVCTVVPVLAATVLFVALLFFLPAHPITKAEFQTYSAQAAFLKWIAYGIPSAIFFLVLPFQFIVRLQRELSADLHAYVLAIVSGDNRAAPPRGSLFLRPWALWVILLAALVFSVTGSAHLLDALKPSQFSNLFVFLVQLRWMLYMAFGIECLIWYGHMINELRRECVTVQELLRAN